MIAFLSMDRLALKGFAQHVVSQILRWGLGVGMPRPRIAAPDRAADYSADLLEQIRADRRD